MDYSFFFRQLQEIINNNGIYFLPIIFIAINLLIFIISRTFRKTGLFVLALAFGLDYAIKSMPFDLYYNVPGLYNAITILYAIGFLIFFIKIAKMLIRMSKLNLDSSFKTDSKIGHFFKFTGIGPFLVMLIANLLKVENFIGQDLTRILTSITILYMLIKTIRSTYKYLSTKESIVLGDKMDFKEIKDYLKEEDKSENKSNSKNQGRKTRKTLNTKTDDPTEVISSKDINNHRIKVQEINQANKEDFDLNDSKDLSNSSNIYDINQRDYANVSGKIISMDFPKYKVNFIMGN